MQRQLVKKRTQRDALAARLAKLNDELEAAKAAQASTGMEHEHRAWAWARA